MAEQFCDAGSGITLCYERFGSEADPPMLMIMGLGTQMIGWPDEFCVLLAERGFHVVRFDNRDIGRSTRVQGRPPTPHELITRRIDPVLYTLSDMAGDAAGLLRELGLAPAHVVGASMGGMIAQTVAIDQPRHVRSLTSIMSTTGDPSVGQSTREALAALLSPPATTRDGAIERTLAILRVIGSPAFELDEADVRRRTGLAFDRAHDPAGVARQFAAIAASADRTAALGSVSVPTLVLHGADDPLVNASGGRATARAIPGAELVLLEGMGHYLSRELWAEIARRIGELVARAEARRAGAVRPR